MAESEDDGPLALATMEEIVEEIRRRTRHFLLVVVRDTTEHSDLTNSWYGGGYHAAVGLCELTKAQFAKDYTERYHE